MPVTSTIFARTTIALLVVGFLAVLGIITASLWLAAQVESFSTSLSTVLEIRREAFGVRSLAVDAETGQRGFLLTQDESYLAPYEMAVGGIEKEMADLRRLVSTLPVLGEAAGRLDALLAAKLSELADTLELARRGDVEGALELVRSDAGKTVMDDIRATSGIIITESNRLITQYNEELAASTRTLIVVLVAGGLVILAVVGGSA